LHQVGGLRDLRQHGTHERLTVHRPTELPFDRRQLGFHEVFHRRVLLRRRSRLRKLTHLVSFGFVARSTLNGCPVRVYFASRCGWSRANPSLSNPTRPFCCFHVATFRPSNMRVSAVPTYCASATFNA